MELSSWTRPSRGIPAQSTAAAGAHRLRMGSRGRGRAEWQGSSTRSGKAPQVTRRNKRIHFIQPLKERIVREVGYGLFLEGAAIALLDGGSSAPGAFPIADNAHPGRD